jgi:hypothetical protein
MKSIKMVSTQTEILYIKVLVLFALVLVAVIFGIAVFSQTEKRLDVGATTDKKQTDLQEKDEVQRLLQILMISENKVKSPKLVTETILKLGTMRDERAIPELVKYLDYEPKFEKAQSQDLITDTAEITHWNDLPTSGRYPAVGSLFQIGKPALPALIKILEERESMSIESKNALRTIQLIFREELPQGIEYLETARDNSTTELGKRRLQIAVSETKMLCEKITKLNPEK